MTDLERNFESFLSEHGYTPWNGYYNGADFWVNGQHGKQV